MELELRTSNGNLFAKMKGQIALGFYNTNHNSIMFEKVSKTFEGKGTFTCLVAKNPIKFGNDTEIEIWLDAGDYVKIVL